MLNIKHFKISTEEIKVIHRLLGFVDEFRVKVGEQESKIRVVDISHVCFLEIILNGEQKDFDYEFSIDKDHFGALTTIPDLSELRIDLKKKNLYAGGISMELKFPILDSNMILFPKKPDLKDLETELLLDLESLQPFIDVYNKAPGMNSPLFLVDEPDKLKIRYHDHFGLRMDIECIHRKVSDEKVMINMEFFVPFLESLKKTGFEDILIGMSTNYPIHIMGDNLNIEIDYFQAPVIEDKDHCKW